MTIRAVLALALCVAGTAAAASGPVGQPLRGTVPRTLAAMTDAGPVPADLVLGHVMVFLGLRDRRGLDAFIAARQDPRSPRFGERLDAAEIADRFGPRRAEYERLRGWFARQGLEIVRDSPFRVGFALRGAAATFERALSTRLRLVRHRGRLRRAPAVDPVLPPEIATSVRGVVGLDDLPAYRPLAQPVPGTVGLSPDDFATIYGATSLRAAFTGAGRSIAVVARSNFEDSDIAGFAGLFGLALNPVRKLARPGDDPGVLSEEGEETEVLLDTQWAGSLAPGAQLNVVIASPEGNIPEALEKAVTDREGDVITISFGLCEPFAPVIAAELFDAFYAIANAQGQTVLVAGGDGGATECEPGDDSLAVNALASSPHAVAVGGTSFALGASGSVPAPLDERVWADGFGGGGGGESILFARPRYQLGAALPSAIGGRLMPDLAVAAGPDAPGYIIFEDGQPHVIGGTSAGAPALASVLALVNERLAAGGLNGLGHVLPDVYRLASAQVRGLGPPVFRDIVAGSNALPGGVGFPAAPGFDLASGWGAPIVDALADALDGPGRCEPEIAPVGGCVVPAAGPKRKACAISWLLDRPNLTLKRDVPSRRQRCRDGDPACDEDGVADGRCTLSVSLCLNVFDFRSSRLSSRRVPRCEPGTVRSVELQSGGRLTSLAADEAAAVRAAIGALPDLPTSLRGACTASVPIAISVAGPGARGRVNLRARARGSLGSTTARVALLCEP
jgi:kumamolisin